MLSQQESKDTPYPAQLDKFGAHKKDLLAILRRVHENNGKFGPFNERQAWQGLTQAGIGYFYRNDPQRKPMLAGSRRDRLNDLAKVITRARKLAHKATQDDVQNDLFRGWHSEIHISDSIDENGSAVLAAFVTEIRSLLDNLARLEALVFKSGALIHPQKGALSETGILTLHDVLKLGQIYKRSTTQDPILEAGPFAEIVSVFLIAVGQEAATKEDYVSEVFKSMCKQLRKRGDFAMLPAQRN
jgi:hypothetical protein